MFSEDLKLKYKEAIKFLNNAISRNKLANAYVFIGREKQDLLLIAKSLSKRLNCIQVTETKPCENCINCKWIEHNEHPQAFTIISPSPDSKKEIIKIDSIREMISMLNNSSDYFRVIYFEKSSLESLPKESSNILLKVVEEPPDKTLFIFANHSTSDILPTILSRSQTLYLQGKYDSINKALNLTDNSSTPANALKCFSKSPSEAIEKGKHLTHLLEELEISPKILLTKIASENYDLLKYSHLKNYLLLHKNISLAYQRLRVFMQPKIVFEDLCLSLYCN